MQIAAPTNRRCDEAEIYNDLLVLDGATIIELGWGCGCAEHTRAIASGGPGRRVIAFEVDRIQHRKNLQ